MKPKIISQIKWTNKLDVFVEHGHQQAVSAGHVNKIKQCMQLHGFLQSKPIMCCRDGNDFKIIDGHHRLRAAKDLNIGVYYVVVDASQADLIGDINTTVRKWPMTAWVNLYLQRGVPDYVILTQYINKGLPLRLAASVLMGESGGSGNFNKFIPKGTYKVKTKRVADKILELRAELAHINEAAESSHFLEALSVLLLLPAFDPSILVQRILANPRGLEKCATREQMFKNIEEVYNFRGREKLNLAFLANELLRERRAFGFKKKKK